MHRRAFTLVELLVVISIIGLLSSIAVVSMSGSRDKAKIASGQSFEQSLHNALGSEVAASFDFEEGSGTTVFDTSGNGFSGSFSGSPTWSTDTFGTGSKYSLSFPGTSYVIANSGLGLSGTNFTVSLWIKTTSASGQLYVFANAGSGDGYRFGLGTGRVAFLLGGTDNYSESECGSKKANDGKWHHIAGSYDVTNHLFSCYVDGGLSGTVALPFAYTNRQDTAPRIGYGPAGSPFVGQLDNVRVYKQSVSGVAIESIYNEEKKYFALTDDDLSGL